MASIIHRATCTLHCVASPIWRDASSDGRRSSPSPAATSAPSRRQLAACSAAADDGSERVTRSSSGSSRRRSGEPLANAPLVLGLAASTASAAVAAAAAEPGGKMTDRLLLAERKNTVEEGKLIKRKKFFDSERRKSASVVSHKARVVKVEMTQLHVHTGASHHALRVHRLRDDPLLKQSNYFRYGPRLSEERLTSWQRKEEQLQRFLADRPPGVDAVLLDGRAAAAGGSGDGAFLDTIALRLGGGGGSSSSSSSELNGNRPLSDGGAGGDSDDKKAHTAAVAAAATTTDDRTATRLRTPAPAARAAMLVGCSRAPSFGCAESGPSAAEVIRAIVRQYVAQATMPVGRTSRRRPASSVHRSRAASPFEEATLTAVKEGELSPTADDEVRAAAPPPPARRRRARSAGWRPPPECEQDVRLQRPAALPPPTTSGTARSPSPIDEATRDAAVASAASPQSVFHRFAAEIRAPDVDVAGGGATSVRGGGRAGGGILLVTPSTDVTSRNPVVRPPPAGPTKQAAVADDLASQLTPDVRQSRGCTEQDERLEIATSAGDSEHSSSARAATSAPQSEAAATATVTSAAAAAAPSALAGRGLSKWKDISKRVMFANDVLNSQTAQPDRANGNADAAVAADDSGAATCDGPGSPTTEPRTDGEILEGGSGGTAATAATASGNGRLRPASLNLFSVVKSALKAEALAAAGASPDEYPDDANRRFRAVRRRDSTPHALVAAADGGESAINRRGSVAMSSSARKREIERLAAERASDTRTIVSSERQRRLESKLSLLASIVALMKRGSGGGTSEPAPEAERKKTDVPSCASAV